MCHPSPKSVFSELETTLLVADLQRWFLENARSLPWRETKDPYKIWLSEVILQQTRIEQGTDYYLRFIECFPTIATLASATEDQVLLLWQGLGYYSRARNLHKAAKIVTKEYGGIFPQTFEQIRKLPGVGDYTAGAIASFAFNLPYPAVDGNVFRFLSRLLNVEIPIDSSQGKKFFSAVATTFAERGRPKVINQALIEMGAIVCTARNPLCHECPVAKSCRVAGLPQAEKLPIKKGKTALTDRYLYYLYLEDDTQQIVLERREGNDIWKGLYQLPLIESKTPLEETILLKAIDKQLNKVGDYHIASHRHRASHILSHQRLHLTFLAIRLKGEINETWLKEKEYIAIPARSLGSYALPAAIFKHLPKLLE